MTEKIKKYWAMLVDNTAIDLIKLAILWVLNSGIFGFFAELISSRFSALHVLRIPMILGFVLISTLVFLEIYVRIRQNRPELPTVNSDYTILNRETFFEYDKTACRYVIKLKLRATCNDMERYKGRYNWSGSDKPTIKSANKKHTLVELARKDTYVEYELLFNQSYKKGQVVDCCVEIEATDSQGIFVPFFSTLIQQPTSCLKLHISVPPKYGVREVICSISAAGVHNSNDIDEVKQLDLKGEYVWEIKSPKLFYSYSIRWQFPDSQN